MKTFFLLLFILLIGVPKIGLSKDASNDTNSLQNFLDLKFFSLSKNDQTAFDTPAAVYILTQEDIRRSGATNIPDALRMVPGLQVAQMGGNTWAIGSRGFDFQFSNKLLVMIDGRIIYTPQFSGVVWDAQDVVLEDVEKIEIIRGPGATVWGANAVNGIINIITKNASSTIGNAVSTSISNNGDKNISIRSGQKGNSGDYRLYAKYIEDAETTLLNGDNANNGLKNKQSGFKYNLDNKDDQKITIQGDIRAGTADNFFSKFPTTTSPFYYVSNRDKNSEGANVIFKLDKKISDTYKINTQLYYDYDYYTITDVLKRNANTIDLNIQNIWELSDRNQFIWGASYQGVEDNLQSEDGTLLTYTKSDEYLSTYSSFLQDRFELIKDKTYLTYGTKIEHNSYTGLEFEPSTKLEYFPTDNQTIWSAVTRAVRTPSRSEKTLTLRYAGAPSGFAAITNGDLSYASEELIAYEAGYRVNYNEKTILEIATFYNDYNKLRTFEGGVAAPYGNVIKPLSAANNGYGESHGIEINNKWQATPQWKLQSSYSLLRMDLKINDGSQDQGPVSLLSTEDYFPENQYKLSSFYNISPELEFDAMVSFIDSLKVGVASYSRIDTRLGWRPEQNVELSILAKNLLNERHQEFTPATYSFTQDVSRTIFVKLTYGF